MVNLLWDFFSPFIEVIRSNLKYEKTELAVAEKHSRAWVYHAKRRHARAVKKEKLRAKAAAERAAAQNALNAGRYLTGFALEEDGAPPEEEEALTENNLEDGDDAHPEEEEDLLENNMDDGSERDDIIQDEEPEDNLLSVSQDEEDGFQELDLNEGDDVNVSVDPDTILEEDDLDDEADDDAV